MKPITAEWVAWAEEDYGSASHLLAATPSPYYNMSCFASQQSAEKYLKARLMEAGIPFPKTHDLANLIDLLAQTEPTWQSLRPAVRRLATLGIEVRYPGLPATASDASQALETASDVRRVVRASLGLAP